MVWCGVCVLCCRGDGPLYVLCILPLGTPATPSSVQCTECLQACFQAPCACMCRYVAAQAARRHTVVPCAPSTGVRCAFSLSCFNMSNWRHYTSLHSLPVYQFCIIALVMLHQRSFYAYFFGTGCTCCARGAFVALNSRHVWFLFPVIPDRGGGGCYKWTVSVSSCSCPREHVLARPMGT